MVDGIELLSRMLGISYTRLYRCVDDAIEKDDVMGVRVLMRCRDRRLVDDVYKVAEYLGRKNMCIDDLFLIPGYRDMDLYDYIAYGAARGGHRDLVIRMMRTGANQWNFMVSSMSVVCHRGSIKIGHNHWNSIAHSAAEGGHRDIVMDMVRMGASDYRGIRDIANRGGYRDIVEDMEGLMYNYYH